MRSEVRPAKQDFRHDARYQVNYYATGEHKNLGTLVLKIVNVSSTGAMVDGKAGIERGDIILLRLPAARDTKALCLWTWHQQAGLEFAQPIIFPDLASTINAMSASPRRS